ncbi:MAG: hypothetical protein Q4C22_06420 [Bacillota bacterium]|nr:hypothetical protein [Bacillota bacterium]
MEKTHSLIDAEDIEMEKLFRKGVEKSIQETLDAGNPVVKYDSELKKPYFLYPNGEKKYAY